MVFSTPFNKRSSYEIAEIESINIQPDFLVGSSLSPGSICREERNGSIALPGFIGEDMEVTDWTESLLSCEEIKEMPSFNLLPNGRRKKSFRTKFRNSFNKKFNFRRAAYALDSRTTSLGDSLTASSKMLKTLVRNTMERLRPSEATWADFEFDDIFSGTNPQFIPFMNMNPMTRMWRE